jgi:signal peptidase I
VLLAAATAIMGGVTVASLLGFRVMIVTSGSMVPAFGPGDAVVIRPGGVEGVGPRGVITFRASGAAGMTTHRVVSVRIIKGIRWFQTKGDANPGTDPNLVPADAVYGRQAMTLPGLGRFLYLALTPKGKLALLGLPLAFLVVQEMGVVMRARRRRLDHDGLEPAEHAAGSWPSSEEGPRHAGPAVAPVPRPDPVTIDLIRLDRVVTVEAELRAQSVRLAAAEDALAALERKLAQLQADNRPVRLSDEVRAERRRQLDLVLSA